VHHIERIEATADTDPPRYTTNTAIGNSVDRLVQASSWSIPF